jgi:hypothetical protein
VSSATKGVLLSGLVCPGLGQIAQKHYLRGVALIGVVTASLFMAGQAVVKGAEGMLAGIRATGGQDSVSALLGEVGRLSASQAAGDLKTPSLLMLACWVIGLVDAYLSGRKIDADTRAHDRAPQPIVTPPRRE